MHMRWSGRRHRRLATLALATTLLTAVGVLISSPAFAGTDDYPAPWRAPTAQDSMVDTWGMYNRECTSFVAWRLHSRNGFEMPFHDNATGWGHDATGRGYVVNMTPALGAVAWWSSGHVAWVEAINGANITIEEYNRDFHGNYSERTIAANTVSGYIHFKDLGAPNTPGPIRALVHGSRVNLLWGAASGASDYQLIRDGAVVTTTTALTFLDVQVSPLQAYGYSVVARNAAGVSAPSRLYVQTTIEAADRAYLTTRDGPAICGRAGGQSSQYLVCNVRKTTGWVSVFSSPNDWGYATDRAWLTNADGTVSYCRRVGTGDQALCDRFDGTAWTSSMSPHTDLAYADNRAYLSTKDGPAICGRAGDQTHQALVCTVNKSTGWVTIASSPNDWGYAADRAWLTNADGTVSYCRRVGTGDQALCDRFDGTAWTSSMSPHYDFGYSDTF